MKILPETFSPPTTKARRIITSGITCVIWLIGLLFLQWNVYEAHFLFMLDMQLFIFFGFLRILFSKQYDKSFYTNLSGRVSFGVLILVFCSGLIFVFTDISPFKANTIDYLFHSTNSIIYGSIALNYLGFFMHDFVFSGDYKTANPYAQGMTDFISVLVIAFALSFTLNFSPKVDGPIFSFYNALGLVFARFALELFLSLKGRKLFENMGS